MGVKTEDVRSRSIEELIIEGAGCASCVGKIESALKSVSGVENAEMNFAQRTVSVRNGVFTFLPLSSHSLSSRYSIRW